MFIGVYIGYIQLDVRSVEADKLRIRVESNVEGNSFRVTPSPREKKITISKQVTRKNYDSRLDSRE